MAPSSRWVSASPLALWSAAVPGALMTLLARGKGVVYAPSTAVALLFGGMLALVVQAGATSAITTGQALAITGLFVALGFWLQWLMARVGLARLARFVPIPVTQGFAAGVGLSLILVQARGLWQSSGSHPGTLLAWHLAIAGAVVAVSFALQRLWPKFPPLLAAVGIVTVCFLAIMPGADIVMAARPHGFTWPVAPDWWDAPWLAVLAESGYGLASLSLLMAVVNFLDVLVFYQHLEAELGHGNDPRRVLSRESLVGMACAVLGMIPATTNSSRSRMAWNYAGMATPRVGQWHALGLIGVAATGHLWLYRVPAPALMGALLVAGWRLIP